MARARTSLRAPDKRMQRVQFQKYKQQAIKKFRTLIAMAKTADGKLKEKAAEASAYMEKLDSVSEEQVAGVGVSLTQLIEDLKIQLDELKLAKPR